MIDAPGFYLRAIRYSFECLIGLLDAKGNLYVTAGLKDHEPGRALLLDKVSLEVTVTGTVVKNRGVQMIYVDSVK